MLRAGQSRAGRRAAWAATRGPGIRGGALGTVAAKVVRISGPGRWEGAARPLAARAALGGVRVYAHKKIRSKTPQGSARYELRRFLSEWCGSRAASRAARQPRRAAKLAAQRCRGGSPAATQGCQRAARPPVQGCQDGSAGLPAWQRRAARMAAQGCQQGSPAQLPGCRRGSPARSERFHPVTTRWSWTGRARREGVSGCEGSLLSRGRKPGRRIRCGHCPHLVRAGPGTSGPAQDPRSLACASPF